jgi:hypothetical protein
MSEDIFECSECGGEYRYSVSQRFENDEPTWGAMGECSACHLREALDSAGLPPPEFRAIVFEKLGVYELTVAPGAEADATVRALQETLALAASTVAPLAQRIPGAVLVGTAHEMEWLAGALRARGIPASAQVADAADRAASTDLADLVPEGWLGKQPSSSGA